MCKSHKSKSLSNPPELVRFEKDMQKQKSLLMSAFETWLTSALSELDIDAEVYSSYIVGMLEGG
jgi:hypothetical protein